jgi:hypothetical protein
MCINWLDIVAIIGCIVFIPLTYVVMKCGGLHQFPSIPELPKLPDNLKVHKAK